MNPGDAQAIIDAVRNDAKTEVVEAGGALMLSVPSGRSLKSIRPFIDEISLHPNRHKGFTRLHTLKSFIDHFKAYCCQGSVVFVDIDDPSMTAVHNYHQSHEDSNGAPGFGDYGARYPFPLSDEWDAWAVADSNAMNQQDFAEFLEDRIGDVISPDHVEQHATDLGQALQLDLASPSQLLTLSRGLTVHVGAKVADHRNLATGEAQLIFEEKHTSDTGGTLKVPGLFVIEIPVFKDGATYMIACRLRYRVRSGQINWIVKTHQADAVYRKAIRGAALQVKNAIGDQKLFHGAH